jgi:DNA mismatch repair protein MLH3
MPDSSKLNSKTTVHGTRGTFLASLSSMALLSITSHHYDYHSHNTIDMHKSEVIIRLTPAPPYQNLKYADHGTRVTVRDLFGNMPVRVKQRAISAEKYRGNSKVWENLRRRVISLLLSWPRDIAVTIREAGTLQKLMVRYPNSEMSASRTDSKISIPRICNILSQSTFITPDEISSWVGVSVSTETLRIDGAISLYPTASKHVQFISFGIEPVVTSDGHTILHDEVNRLFSNSAFGNEEDADPDEVEKLRRANDRRYKSDGYTIRELKGARKGVDRWPMFYINIQPNMEWLDCEKLDVEDIFENKRNALAAIVDLLQAMISAFLTRHQFKPKTQPKISLGQEPSKDNLSRVGEDQREVLSDAVPPSIPRSASAPLVRTTSILKRRPQEAAHFKEDLLGMNVNLPSFRHSSKFESPFDSWTKVKRGSSNLGKTGQRVNNLQDTSFLVSSERIHTGPESAKHAPLLSSSGKVIRRPFAEIETRTLSSPRSTPQSSNKDPREILDSKNGDDVIEWINPTTKVKMSVNTRTGHSFTAKKPISVDGLSLTLRDKGRFVRSQSKSVKDETIAPNSTKWVADMMKTWENPVFAPVEATIPEVSIGDFGDSTSRMLHGHKQICTKTDFGRAWNDSTKVSGKISRESLEQARMISQIDNKFILVKVSISKGPKSGAEADENETLLVAIDQHAADERIRIEALMEELCTPYDASLGECGSEIHTIMLEKPLAFEISSRESQLLRVHRDHFSRWGILFDVTDIGSKSDKGAIQPSTYRVEVRSLPPTIVERCKVEPRLLIELLRIEAWKCTENPPTFRHSSTEKDDVASRHSWIHRIHSCPQGLLDMLNSRACRSAIMFNDPLSLEQCETLVRKLANCMFPFQCAHGRPSLVPLVDLGIFQGEVDDPGRNSRGDKMDFATAMRNWRKDLGKKDTGASALSAKRM